MEEKEILVELETLKADLKSLVEEFQW